VSSRLQFFPMTGSEEQDPPIQDRLSGEDAPTWLAVGFAMSGVLVAVVAAWLALGGQPMEPPQRARDDARSELSDRLPTSIAILEPRADASRAEQEQVRPAAASTASPPPDVAPVTATGDVAEVANVEIKPLTGDGSPQRPAALVNAGSAKPIITAPAPAPDVSSIVSPEDMGAAARVEAGPARDVSSPLPMESPVNLENAKAIPAAAGSVPDGGSIASPGDMGEAPSLAAEPTDAEACPPRIAVSFKLGSAQPITSNVQPEIDALQRFLARHVQARLLVEGHTDALGSDSHNVLLSYQRAKVVAATLTKAGLADARLDIRAAGSGSPIEGLPASSAQNRRVVLRILGVEACQQAQNRPLE
jgi:outer membrane protein OmpA-like peptidoglycan-associated protein